LDLRVVPHRNGLVAEQLLAAQVLRAITTIHGQGDGVVVVPVATGAPVVEAVPVPPDGLGIDGADLLTATLILEETHLVGRLGSPVLLYRGRAVLWEIHQRLVGALDHHRLEGGRVIHGDHTTLLGHLGVDDIPHDDTDEDDGRNDECNVKLFHGC